MKKSEPEKTDELRPEYDLRNLRVRKLGPWRKNFGGTVRAEDAAGEFFLDADVSSESSDEHPTDSFDL